MKPLHPAFVMCFHLLFLAVLLVFAGHAALGDWGNYYFGSKAIAAGYGFRMYDPVFFNQYVETQGQSHFFLSYTQVPPLSAVIYYPFTFLNVALAKTLFGILSILFCCFSFARFFRKMKIDLRWSLLLPVLFFLPLKSNADLGQSYLLLLALLLEGWMAREEKKTWLAAVCFALAIHLKIFPAIVLLWFLFEKDWKTFAATILTGAALLLISLPFVHWEVWQSYSSEILPRLAKGEITNTYATAYQSMHVFLKQLFIPDQLHNPNAVFDNPLLYVFANMLWRGIVLVSALLFTFDKKQNSFTRFSVWLFAGLLLSGYGSSYGLLQLSFLALAFFMLEISVRKKMILLVVVGIACNIPVQWFAHYTLPFSFPRLILLLLVFILLLFVLRPKWNSFSLFALLFLAPLLFGAETAEDYGSEYVLKQEPSLLITDVQVMNDSVVYKYRDTDGLHTGETAYGEKISSEEICPVISSNEVQWKERVFHFKGQRVRDAYLINGNTLLYLSDLNRGVGFYTIRKIKFSGSEAH